MKRILCFCIGLVLCLLTAAAAAEDAALPSIDMLIGMGENQRVEVSDNLDAYSVFNEQWSDWPADRLKFIILERRSPEKEFTELMKYPPFSDNDGFPADFDGVDLGESRVWYRGDLMENLSSDFRANSLEDATYIILAEDIYFLASTIVVTNYKKKDNEEAPEFESTEEMIEYFAARQPEVESKAYYPVFESFAFISIYETATKRSALYDTKQTPGKLFARNPDASRHWNNMVYLAELMDILADENAVDASAAKELIESYDFVSQEEKDLWISCLSLKKYGTAGQLALEYFWKMTEDLKQLDPSEKNQKNYDLIIQERNITALGQYVQYCDYGGFEKSMDSIRDEKDYLAAPDWEWQENTLQDMIYQLFGES
ncbi:MAG: hypothetical protein IKQ45_02160 [Clostridia bacterium]|nr:hypothetical protein [Clostridia bacterium]